MNDFGRSAPPGETIGLRLEKPETPLEQVQFLLLDSFDLADHTIWFDSMRVIGQLDQLNISPEALEQSISLVEQKILEKLEVLEKTELRLRGDCLTDEKIDSFLVDSPNALCLKSFKVPANIDVEEKKKIISSLLQAISARINIAYTYKEKKPDDERIPCLLYAMGDKPAERPQAEDWFHGATDDIGARKFQKGSTFVIELPNSREELFRPLAQRQANRKKTPGNHLREERLQRLRPGVHDIYGVNRRLGDPRSYLNTSLMAYEMLFQMSTQDL